jgi:hypothetical protein
MAKTILERPKGKQLKELVTHLNKNLPNLKKPYLGTSMYRASRMMESMDKILPEYAQFTANYMFMISDRLNERFKKSRKLNQADKLSLLNDFKQDMKDYLFLCPTLIDHTDKYDSEVLLTMCFYLVVEGANTETYGSSFTSINKDGDESEYSIKPYTISRFVLNITPTGMDVVVAALPIVYSKHSVERIIYRRQEPTILSCLNSLIIIAEELHTGALDYANAIVTDNTNTIGIGSKIAVSTSNAFLHGSCADASSVITFWKGIKKGKNDIIIGENIELSCQIMPYCVSTFITQESLSLSQAENFVSTRTAIQALRNTGVCRIRDAVNDFSVGVNKRA